MSKELVSGGLAIGYFYNFIKKIFDNITHTSEVKKGNNKFPFIYNHVLLEVIIPKTLNKSDIEKCNQFVLENDKVFLSIEGGRDLSFFIENLKHKNIKIIDYPTTIDSLIEFLRIDSNNFFKYNDLDVGSEEWKEKEKLELDKFKNTLDFLINNNSLTRGKVVIRILAE